MLETGDGEVTGIEVRAAASVNSADFAGLRKLAQAAGNDFIAVGSLSFGLGRVLGAGNCWDNRVT